MQRIIVLFSIILLLVPFTAVAQDFCEGNFDYDSDQDGTDAFTFKTDFGRSTLLNPCPPDGPALVQKTGQTTSYAAGDDGELEKGVPWPNPRFTDNLDGTISDNLTGLIWLENANCITTHYPGFDNDDTAGDGMVTWQHALDFVAGINDGTYPNCGASATDWRLPNRNELDSLVDARYSDPPLSNAAGTGHWTPGDPFINVQSSYYWTSTSVYADVLTNYAWTVIMYYGDVYMGGIKTFDNFHVWPVRGGH